MDRHPVVGLEVAADQAASAALDVASGAATAVNPLRRALRTGSGPRLHTTPH
jgi:hypothetical protein